MYQWQISSMFEEARGPASGISLNAVSGLAESHA